MICIWVPHLRRHPIVRELTILPLSKSGFLPNWQFLMEPYYWVVFCQSTQKSANPLLWLGELCFSLFSFTSIYLYLSLPLFTQLNHSIPCYNGVRTIRRRTIYKYPE